MKTVDVDFSFLFSIILFFETHWFSFHVNSITKTFERYRRCCYALRENNDPDHDRQVFLEIPLQFHTSILGTVMICSVHVCDMKIKYVCHFIYYLIIIIIVIFLLLLLNYYYNYC